MHDFERFVTKVQINQLNDPAFGKIYRSYDVTLSCGHSYRFTESARDLPTRNKMHCRECSYAQGRMKV